jgi:hypothetical protein
METILAAMKQSVGGEVKILAASFEFSTKTFPSSSSPTYKY